jgi:hypothetical protein
MSSEDCAIGSCIDANLFLFPQLHRESVLVKPINTPITPLCSKSGKFTTLYQPMPRCGFEALYQESIILITTSANPDHQ